MIDEADRLLAQSFQDWLAQVLAATRRTSTDSTELSSLDLPVPTDALPNPDGLAPTFLHTLQGQSH